jgi:hypothetical protein
MQAVRSALACAARTSAFDGQVWFASHSRVDTRGGVCKRGVWVRLSIFHSFANTSSQSRQSNNSTPHFDFDMQHLLWYVMWPIYLIPRNSSPLMFVMNTVEFLVVFVACCTGPKLPHTQHITTLTTQFLSNMIIPTSTFQTNNTLFENEAQQ